MTNHKLQIEIDSELRPCLDDFCSKIEESIKTSDVKDKICNFQIGEGMRLNENPYSITVKVNDINEKNDKIRILITLKVYVELIEDNETILSVVDEFILKKLDRFIMEWVEKTELSRFSIQHKETNQSGEKIKQHTYSYRRNLTYNYSLYTVA